MTWDIRTGDAVDHAAYDALLERSPAASYLQELDWPDFAARKARHDYLPVTVARTGKPILLAGLLRRTQLTAGFSIGAFRRGPVTATPADLETALPPLVAQLRRMRVLSVTLNPRWTDAQIEPACQALAAVGARVLPEDRQTLHTTTGMIDLDADLETVRARYKGSVRTKLRKAERGGVTIGPAARPDALTAFEGWLDALSQRTGYDVSGLPSPAAQFDHADRKGGLAREIWLDGQRVGVFTALRDRSRLLFSSVGWSDDSTHLPRLSLIIDDLVREGLSMQGVTSVDLGGVQDPDQRGKDEAADNRERGKLASNPRLVTLLPIHEIATVPGMARPLALVRRLRS